MLVYALEYPDLPPKLFSLYAYESPQPITPELILGILNGELPSIYNPNDELNKADNFGMSTVLAAIYQQVYTLFYNSIMSVGSGNQYNQNWEFVYIGINNLLQNAAYPAQLLSTLMRIPTQTSIQIAPMALFISRIAFQYSGSTTPVQIVYNLASDEYLINLYTSENVGWQLGVPGRTELGESTYLFETRASAFLYILCSIIGRLMPVQIKYSLEPLSKLVFNTDFNTAVVEIQDYIDPAVQYDAYEVVNNNNTLNAKGYFLN
jgi:hypothetical protein